MGAVGIRSLTALLALATIAIGLGLSAAAQLVVLILLLVGMLYVEQSGPRGFAATDSPLAERGAPLRSPLSQRMGA